jgi:hypothetical protein
MLVYSPLQIISDTRIENLIILIGQYILRSP